MSASANEVVVIVGAGHAGAHAARSLRKHGFLGELQLFGEEPSPPYQRPPLSKAYLMGALPEERLNLLAARFYKEHQIALRLNARVEAIDRGAGRIVLADGERVAYDRLILATGAAARPLPIDGGTGEGVLTLRGLADSQRLRERLAGATHIAVIGGGYIGLEVAAAARALGVAVTVVERMPRLLSRVAGPVISTYYRDLHQAHGVRVVCERTLDAIAPAARGGLELLMGDGERISADLALAGIGAVPNVALAERAGLLCDNGVVVDEHARTSDPHIYAAGDCTSRPLAGRHGRYRLESVNNAQDQAEHAAAHIAGAAAPVSDAPWFWSDQYDVKLQTVGVLTGYTEQITRGDPAEGRFAVFYYAGDTLLAVDAVNEPQSFLGAKQLLKRGVSLSKTDAADPSVSLKAVLAGA